MPPIRRILVLAADGSQSLDVLGPVEVFSYADRHAPGSYEAMRAMMTGQDASRS